MPVPPGYLGRFAHADQSVVGGDFGDEPCDAQESRMHTVFANARDMGIASTARTWGGLRAYPRRYSGVDEKAILDPGTEQTTPLQELDKDGQWT